MGRQKQRQRDRRRVQRQAPEGTRARVEPERSGSAGLSRPTLIGGGIVMLAAIAIFAYAALRPHSSSTATTTTPTVAPTAQTAASLARTVDGVACGQTEQLVYHIHQHISLYDHGRHLSIPALIGIPTTVQNGNLTARCFYWIHVHPPGSDNIIHVESPLHKTFTLGDFFDIWAATAATTQPRGDAFVQRLSSASASQITAFYNGKRWTAGYRSIPLKQHANITVEIGTPTTSPKPFNGWSALGL